jgi:hypothetical protein
MIMKTNQLRARTTKKKTNRKNDQSIKSLDEFN